MKILLLEPDEYYHHQFRERLGPTHEITVAKSLESAKAHLSLHEPDALIVELLLEDGASFPIIRALKHLKSNSSVPVIIFSQIDNLEDIEHAMSLGVSGYFVKGKDAISDVNRLLLTLNAHHI